MITTLNASPVVAPVPSTNVPTFQLATPNVIRTQTARGRPLAAVMVSAPMNQSAPLVENLRATLVMNPQSAQQVYLVSMESAGSGGSFNRSVFGLG